MDPSFLSLSLSLSLSRRLTQLSPFFNYFRSLDRIKKTHIEESEKHPFPLSPFPAVSVLHFLPLIDSLLASSNSKIQILLFLHQSGLEPRHYAFLLMHMSTTRYIDHEPTEESSDASRNSMTISFNYEEREKGTGPFFFVATDAASATLQKEKRNGITSPPETDPLGSTSRLGERKSEELGGEDGNTPSGPTGHMGTTSSSVVVLHEAPWTKTYVHLIEKNKKHKLLSMHDKRVLASIFNSIKYLKPGKHPRRVPKGPPPKPLPPTSGARPSRRPHVRAPDFGCSLTRPYEIINTIRARGRPGVGSSSFLLPFSRAQLPMFQPTNRLHIVGPTTTYRLSRPSGGPPPFIREGRLK
ncbi:hypothetical protein H6P81_001961 [Aristolochia fimbriata]|uniref:Uncharacterized protein n=1 Tax=Aristolochia fimbriata TaxID=158543 RepID=A0AAV7F921_ARIFI|nr:hypothetical protein H6P81_001961 [Aristolochia fimbriata]